MSLRCLWYPLFSGALSSYSLECGRVLSASVSIRSMLFWCEDCLSHVPYQSDIRTGMEPARDCPWCGLVWLVSCRWPQSGEWAGKFIFFFLLSSRFCMSFYFVSLRTEWRRMQKLNGCVHGKRWLVELANAFVFKNIRF